MRLLFSALFFVVFAHVVSAQKIVIPKNRIPVQHPDFHAWVEVYEGEIKHSALDDRKFYAWLKAKQVHTSRGGYEGELLHGNYTALYKTDALKEKGVYNKGLKTGTWKEWHINGELKCVSHWKKGNASGNFTYYNTSGKMVQRENYKNGHLHGRQYTYSDSAETISRYRNGKKIIPKQKIKKQKVKAVRAKEVLPEKDSLTKTDTLSQKPKKGFFNLRKKTPAEKPVHQEKKTKKENPAEEKKQAVDRNSSQDTKEKTDKKSKSKKEKNIIIKEPDNK